MLPNHRHVHKFTILIVNVEVEVLNLDHYKVQGLRHHSQSFGTVFGAGKVQECMLICMLTH